MKQRVNKTSKQLKTPLFKQRQNITISIKHSRTETENIN